MQIKILLHAQCRMAIIEREKDWKITGVGEDVEKLESSFRAGGN